MNIRKYFFWKETEVKIAWITTLLISCGAYLIDIYANFQIYQEPLKNICIYLAAGLLGMIGTILTGIAILLSIIDKKFSNNLKRSVKNKKDPAKEIMNSFKFITFIIGFASIIFFVLYFVLNINIIIPKWSFYLIIAFASWFIVFIIFFMIGLIDNIIKLFFIKNMYEEIEENEKTVYEYANEIRIDYLMDKVIKDTVMRNRMGYKGKNKKELYEEILSELRNSIDLQDGIEVEKKEQIIKYFEQYYDN